MRLVLAFVLALAAAGCAGDHCGFVGDTNGPDLGAATGCNSTSASRDGACQHPDMTMQD